MKFDVLIIMDLEHENWKWKIHNEVFGVWNLKNIKNYLAKIWIHILEEDRVIKYFKEW